MKPSEYYSENLRDFCKYALSTGRYRRKFIEVKTTIQGNFDPINEFIVNVNKLADEGKYTHDVPVNGIISDLLRVCSDAIEYLTTSYHNSTPERYEARHAPKGKSFSAVDKQLLSSQMIMMAYYSVFNERENARTGYTPTDRL